MIRRALLGLVVALLPAPGQARGVDATSDAAEAVKLAVVIGSNRGHRDSRPLRYAEQDARKVYGVLTDLGGFERGNTRLLLGQDARRVWRALRWMERRAARLKREGTSTLLLVYYSGHADGEALELGRSSLSFARLKRFMRACPARVRLAFIDSCRSGRLVGTKGGRRGAGYQIRVADRVSSEGYALITSSAANELSQESAEIRGSFFTHYLLSALRGAGDASRDGRVTLSEAYRYAYRRTVARTAGTLSGSQHPMYDFRIAGHGDIVLTVTGPRANLVLRSGAAGRLFVLDRRGATMVAESPVRAGRATRLALANGDYDLILLQEGGGARRAKRRLVAGQPLTISDSEFAAFRLRRGVAKGGLFPHRPGHVLRSGFVVRRMPLAGGGAALGGALDYGLALWPRWQLAARASWTTAADAGLSTGYHDVGLLLGGRWRWGLARLDLELGLMVGYEHLLQGKRAGRDRHSGGLVYLGLAGASLPLSRHLLLFVEGGVGGRLFRLRAGGLTHRIDVQLLSGVGWRWGGAP